MGSKPAISYNDLATYLVMVTYFPTYLLVTQDLVLTEWVNQGETR